MHALNRRLTADDRHSKRLCWALAMSDLTGCYDRIVHNAAALALLRIGVSNAKIHTMFASIQRMIHRVRTVFGDSELTYGGDDFEIWLFAPLFGLFLAQLSSMFSTRTAIATLSALPFRNSSSSWLDSCMWTIVT